MGIKKRKQRLLSKMEKYCRTKTKPTNKIACLLCRLEKYEIKKLKKELSLNIRKERQQSCHQN